MMESRHEVESMNLVMDESKLEIVDWNTSAGRYPGTEKKLKPRV